MMEELEMRIVVLLMGALTVVLFAYWHVTRKKRSMTPARRREIEILIERYETKGEPF